MLISESDIQMTLGYGHRSSALIARLCVNVLVIFRMGIILLYLANVVLLERFQAHLVLLMLVLAELARLESILLQEVPHLANYVLQELTPQKQDPLIKVPYIPKNYAL